MNNRSIQLRVGLLALGLLSMVWGFQALVFSHMPSIFNDPLEDMSFGWYVPVFSLYVVWTEREKIFASVGSPSWVGALLTLPCLFVGFLGVRGIQVRLEIVAFIGLLVTLPWAFFGRKTAQAILFPAAFLLFCVPLATFLDIVTVHLRLFATGMAYAILKGVGAGVVRTGTMLAAADGSFAIDIAEPCSGLRSIFALMALTAGYAYFTQPTWIRRAALFACSVPLAILGNVMRILTICLVGTYCSSEFATGFYHDYSGYVVFLVAILLMVACGELISRLAGKLKIASKPPQPHPSSFLLPTSSFSSKPPKPSKLPYQFLILIPFIAVMVMMANTPAATLCEAPKIVLGEIPGFTSEKKEISEAELTVLPADTQIEKRLYTAPNGHWFLVSAVIGGKSKSSIHRPELCLPAQGFLMTNPRTVELGEEVWRFITLDGGPDRPKLGFAYTFFNQAGYHTSSHVSRILRDVWDRSMFNRIDRWVMITINTSRSDDYGVLDFIQKLKGELHD